MIKQKDDVVYIQDPSPLWKFWSPIQIDNSPAIVISLQQDQAIALLLKKDHALGKQIDENTMKEAHKVKVEFGKVNTLIGRSKEGVDFDLCKPLPKT